MDSCSPPTDAEAVGSEQAAARSNGSEEDGWRQGSESAQVVSLRELLLLLAALAAACSRPRDEGRPSARQARLRGSRESRARLAVQELYRSLR